MSGITSILVPVGDEPGRTIPLKAAVRLAKNLSARVIGVHVRADPHPVVPLVAEGMSEELIEKVIETAEIHGAAAAKTAKHAFEAMCEHYGVRLVPPGIEDPSAEWLDVTGTEDAVVALRARVSDMVVLARPPSEEALRNNQTMTSALLESGRPLLLIPPGFKADFGDNVAIAWNGSCEVSRAVALSLPILRRAGTVTVLWAPEMDEASSIPVDAFITYLAGHGISAKARKISPKALPSEQGQSSGGASLLKECVESGANLLVMGAYTRSRWRQLEFGGVTSHVLANAHLPCLMCH